MLDKSILQPKILEVANVMYSIAGWENRFADGALTDGFFSTDNIKKSLPELFENIDAYFIAKKVDLANREFFSDEEEKNIREALKKVSEATSAYDLSEACRFCSRMGYALDEKIMQIGILQAKTNM